MRGYNSFDFQGASNTGLAPNQSVSEEKKEEGSASPPHLYSTPLVSAPLITAYGLPTLIECEPPSSASAPEGAGGTATAANSTTGSADKEENRPPSTPQFSSLRAKHNRSLSLPVATAKRGDEDQVLAPLRLLSKSLFGIGIGQESPTEAAPPSINAYTFRVRTLDTESSDEHRLRLCQNPDGTYSHAATMQNETDNIDFDYGKDDVGETEEGIHMSTMSTDPSVPLETVTHLEETITDMDSGALPPHVHPSVPEEMLHPELTKTAPPLKLWPLAVLVFYNVSGGPFGIEPTIRAGGNFYAIIGFLVFPLIWSVPEALVTAELGAAFQDPSAGVAWVEQAFGGKGASLCGYLGWVSGATDNAIYPTLFMEYATSVAGWDKDEFAGLTRFISIAAITICLAMLNYSGLEIVGNASLLVCIIAMSPFLILTVLGAPKVDPARWFQMPEEPDSGGTELFDDDFQTSPGPLPLFTLGNILWRPYLNNLFWNLNSFDSVASFAGETSNMPTTYPRAIFIGLILCVLSYIVPLLVAVGATDYTQAEWVDGHLGAVAVDIGGAWLGGWTIFAAGISNLAMFEAEMSSDAFKLMGMAERGYLPKIFQTRSKFGTPTAGIIFNTVVIVAFSCADFGQLLELLNSVYAISLLLEYAAFVKLRLFHKELQRPYRIPVPDWAAVLVVLPPTLGIFAVFATSNWYVYVFCVGALLFGYTMFHLLDLSKQRGWFTYESKAANGNNQYGMPPVDCGNGTNGHNQYAMPPLDSDHELT